jgi:hypothetical protein
MFRQPSKTGADFSRIPTAKAAYPHCALYNATMERPATKNHLAPRAPPRPGRAGENGLAGEAPTNVIAGASVMGNTEETHNCGERERRA